MSKLQNLLASFLNGVLDQVIDHLKVRLEEIAAELDTKYGITDLIKELTDALEDDAPVA